MEINQIQSLLDAGYSANRIAKYYPYISADLQRKIDAFIRKASAVKFGGDGN